MTTLYANVKSGAQPDAPGGAQRGYDTYVEPDTRIPPKARPVLDAVSVNGVAIPETAILSEAQNHPGANPGEAVRAAARALAVRELLLQEARRQAVEAVPGEDGEGRLETAEDAAIRALIDHMIEVPRATETECRRYFERNRKTFRTDPLWEARHILLAASKDDVIAWDKARLKANELCQVLHASPSTFAAAAVAWSACSSKDDGGRLGQISRGETTDAFEAALETMQAGEISRVPVETAYGYHIIALDRFVSGQELPFDHVKARIAGWLEARSWSRAVSQYIALCAASAEIVGIDLDVADGPLVQ